MDLKITRKNTNLIWNHLLTLLGIVLLASCTKTETIPYTDEPQARITSFKIVNTAEEIVGAINENEKTITVTIPAGQYLTTLDPKITVAEDCTLGVDAEDLLITDLITYFAEGSTREITYPVTGADGSTATYRLLIKTNQPPLLMQEVTTDAANPVSYNQTNWSTNNEIVIYNTLPSYPYPTVSELDAQLIKVSLIAEDGTEYKLKTAQSQSDHAGAVAAIRFVLNNIEGRITGSVREPIYNQTPPAGLYYIKLWYYSREATLKNPIRIYYNN